MMGRTRRTSGFGTVELLLALVIIVLMGFLGWMIYHGMSARPTSNPQKIQQASSKTTTSAVDPYAGWKTYTLAEDTTISFRYPSGWIVLGDYKDTTSAPYNRFFKVVAPDKYHGNDVVFIFRYAPGKNNQFTRACLHDGGYTNTVAAEDTTVAGRKLKILTNAASLDAINMITMALVDSSNCYVAVPSGVIEATEHLGSQSAPTYSLDLATWQSLPQSKTIDLIMKSIKFQ